MFWYYFSRWPKWFLHFITVAVNTTNRHVNLRWGIIQFINSEIFFFMPFFWAFFHNSFSPTGELSLLCLLKIIILFNPIQIPLVNTLILVRSEISVTWPRHRLIKDNYNQSFQGHELINGFLNKFSLFFYTIKTLFQI